MTLEFDGQVRHSGSDERRRRWSSSSPVSRRRSARAARAMMTKQGILSRDPIHDDLPLRWVYGGFADRSSARAIRLHKHAMMRNLLFPRTTDSRMTDQRGRCESRRRFGTPIASAIGAYRG